jgi:hypothetical protein
MISAFRLKGQSPGVGLALLIAACLTFGSGEASAQQKHKYFFKAPPGTTKYTQTHLMEVGDVPGHQVRLAELISKYPGDAPVYDGVKVVEVRGVLVSDYIDGNGKASSYNVSTLENGDKIFTRSEVLTHTTVGADGGRRINFTTVATLTGGTGRFKGIRGTLRGSGATDLKTGTSGAQTEGEYWFEK